MKYPFKNLVFEGGGVKGIAYVGAMEVLDDEDILGEINRIGGTSAGSINAMLFAAGFDDKETLKALKEVDFNDFKDDSWGVLKDLYRLKDKFGWHKGNFFREWLSEMLEKKNLSPNITFKALKKATGKDLFLYATNLSTGFGEKFSPEHTPRTRVVDAVRRSMSIPLFFTAIRDDRDDVFVDGGVVNNYPIKLFDREDYLDNRDLRRIPEYYEDENKLFRQISPSSSPYVYNKETLGFRLDSGKQIAVFRDGQTPVSHDIDNFLDYTMRLIITALSVQDSQHLHSDDWHRTIYIDTKGVSTFDFDLSSEKKDELIEEGRKATKKYLEWWSDTSNDMAVNHPESTD